MGVKLVIVGGPYAYCCESPPVTLVPTAVVTLTLTTPVPGLASGEAGVTAISFWVLVVLVDATVADAVAHGVPPEAQKLTVEPPVSCWPVIVTVCPPATGPAFGLIAVTTGGP